MTIIVKLGELIRNNMAYIQLVILVFLASFVQAQTVTWNQRIEGNSDDFLNSVELTSDGGYLAIGNTRSFGAGTGDGWVLRVDGSGKTVWQFRYGSGLRDQVQSARKIADGGFILSGFLTGNASSSADAWLLRLNSEGGIVWQRSYGGSSSDRFYSAQPLPDGGFIAAGETSSFGSGGSDAWIVRLNSAGDVVWQRTLGSSVDDGLRAIQNTSDGGWIAGGYTSGFGAENSDAWVLRLNSEGGIVWQRKYGTSDADSLAAITQTRDKGFIFAGSIAGAQQSDGWIVRLNPAGGSVWQRKAGNTESDRLTDVQQTADGGYITSGISTVEKISKTWMIRFNAGGGRLWQNFYGNAVATSSPSVRQTVDNGFILVTELLKGNGPSTDGAVFKLDRNGNAGQICSSLVTKSNSIVSAAQSTSAATTASAVNSAARVSSKGVARKVSGATFSEACESASGGTSRSGTFVPNPGTGYTVRGAAVLQQRSDGSLELMLGTDFQSSNGPRLEVYLSTASSVNSGITSLGRLMSTSGAQTYSIPAGIQLNSYNHVLIHCVSFNVTFGFAQLQ